MQDEELKETDIGLVVGEKERNKQYENARTAEPAEHGVILVLMTRMSGLMR